MKKKRFILFLGKGGVGKTVISAAYALECAKRGEKTLLLNLHTSDKVAHIFKKPINDREITSLCENLYATTVTPESALEEYVILKFKIRLIYKAVFENKIVSAFLSAIPGLDDLVMLGKAYWHVTQREGDHDVWDKVVVDAPATGHGIFFLQIPSVISELLNSGNMYEEAQKMQAILSNAEITELNLITLAEEMPVNESKMLLKTARERLKLPVNGITANAVLPNLFKNQKVRRIIESIPLPSCKEDLKGGSAENDFKFRLLESAKFRLQRQRSQHEELKEIEESIRAVIDYQFSKELDLAMLERIAASLGAQLDPTDDDIYLPTGCETYPSDLSR